MSVWLTADIAESNINIPNNTSLVSVNLYINWDGGSWAQDNPYGYIIIDGTTYGFNANFNPNQTSSGASLLTTKSNTVTHNTDGTKTVNCSAGFEGTRAGTGQYVTWSGSKTLYTIPRGSVIGTVSNFNLEDSFSVPITKYSSSFTDTLTISIGGTLIKTIPNYTSGTLITLTDSELLSAYNAVAITNTNTTVTFGLTTYSGSTAVGTSSAAATAYLAGTIWIRAGSVWRRAVPFIKAGGSWKRTVAYINKSGWERGI